MIPIVDGTFTYAREIEGSPSKATDPVTGSLLITRRYVILTANYRPLAAGALDPVFRDAVLINETTDQVIGVLTFFTRNYAQIPATRTEPRRMAFTMPGKSAVQISEITGAAVGWNPYGEASPYTRDVTATAVISYELNPTVVLEQLSVATYRGAPVDYIGEVWVFVGNVEVPRPGGVVITEPRFRFAGFTNYLFVPTLWIAEISLQRWLGPIWEKQVVTVNTFWLRN